MMDIIDRIHEEEDNLLPHIEESLRQGDFKMIYSAAQARKRAVAEYQAEHQHDHLLGKMLSWAEVGDGFEEQLSSPILKVHCNGREYFVDEAGERRWIKEGQYVKNIQVEE